MAVDERKVEEFEERYKEVVFNRITELSSVYSKVVDMVQTNGKDIDGLNTDLPNIGITLNNKVGEMNREFKKYELSIFAYKVENYGPLRQNYITSSLVGDAIIEDMIEKTNKAMKALDGYNDVIINSIERKNRHSSRAVEKVGPMRRFFAIIRGLMMGDSKYDIEKYTPEEICAMNSCLEDYRYIDEKLWKYRLKDNLVPSVVNYIKKQGYKKNTICSLMDSDIIPVFEKLNFRNLIPELEEKVQEECDEDDLFSLSEKSKNWNNSMRRTFRSVTNGNGN